MPTNHLHRQLLMAGLHQAAGTVLWGKLRHVTPVDQPEATTAVDTGPDGGHRRSRSRKARS